MNVPKCVHLNTKKQPWQPFSTSHVIEGIGMNESANRVTGKYTELQLILKNIGEV